MFGFKKKEEDRIEPEFDTPTEEQSVEQKNLADILGAQENDTNITAGVDALLDDEGEIGSNRSELAQESVHVPAAADFQQSDENLQDTGEEEYEYEYVEDDGQSSDDEYEYVEDDGQSSDDGYEYVEDDGQSSDDGYEYVEDDGQPSDDGYEYVEEISQENQPADLVSENAEPIDLEAPFDGITETMNTDVSGLADTGEEENPAEVQQPEENLSSKEEVVSTESEEPVLDDILGDASQSIDDILDLGETSVDIDEITTDVEKTQEEKVSEPVDESKENIEPLPENEKAEEITVQEDVSAEKNETQQEISESNSSEDMIWAEPVDYKMPEVPVISEEKVREMQSHVKSVMDNAVSSQDFSQQSDDKNRELYTVSEAFADNDKVKVINKYSGTDAWQRDKYQQYIKLEVEDRTEAEKWQLMIIKQFSVPLQKNSDEVVIDKADNVFRFASLMSGGEEKLKIFNQSTYKFVVPQDEFYKVQGNVIMAGVDETFSLGITDYINVALDDKLDKALHFTQPVSGFIFGPQGAKIAFADLEDLCVRCQAKPETEDIMEYIPSLKGFDGKGYFVYDEADGIKEFIAHGKQKYLVINIGNSLYGWNVRFDNEMRMSLRDALEYQSRYKRLPSANGEIVHGENIFKFFGIEKLQAREKTVYYSYGKV